MIQIIEPAGSIISRKQDLTRWYEKTGTADAASTVGRTSGDTQSLYLRARCIITDGTFAGSAPTGNPATTHTDGVTLADGDLIAIANGSGNIYNGLWRVNTGGAWNRAYPQFHRRGIVFTVWDGIATPATNVYHDTIWMFTHDADTLDEGVTLVDCRQMPLQDKGDFYAAGPTGIVATVGVAPWIFVPVPPARITPEFAQITNTNYIQCAVAGIWTFRFSTVLNIAETAGLQINAANQAAWWKVQVAIEHIPAATGLPTAAGANLYQEVIRDDALPYQHDFRREGNVQIQMAVGDRVAWIFGAPIGAGNYSYTLQDYYMEIELGVRR